MNTVNLIGRLTTDPELGYTANTNTPVCTLRLAVNRPPKGGKDQRAVFIDVVSFNGQAEAIAAHLPKGRQVAVSGRSDYSEWEADDGTRRSRHQVIANQVDFLAKPTTQTQPETYAASEERFEERSYGKLGPGQNEPGSARCSLAGAAHGWALQTHGGDRQLPLAQRSPPSSNTSGLLGVSQLAADACRARNSGLAARVGRIWGSCS